MRWDARTGVDASTSAVLTYPKLGAQAVVTCSLDTPTAQNSIVVTGTKGTLSTFSSLPFLLSAFPCPRSSLSSLAEDASLHLASVDKQRFTDRPLTRTRSPSCCSTSPTKRRRLTTRSCKVGGWRLRPSTFSPSPCLPSLPFLFFSLPLGARTDSLENVLLRMENSAVARCLRDGKKEEPLMPWSETVLQQEIFDAIVHSAGFKWDPRVEGM